MKIYKFIFILAIFALVSCVTTEQKFDSQEVIKEYVTALQEKDIQKIKAISSKKTIKLMEETSKDEKISLEEAIRKNEPVIPPMLKTPEIRNEKIQGDRATVEIKNPINDSWTELLFVREDGKWKMGAGDMVDEVMNELDERMDRYNINKDK